MSGDTLGFHWSRTLCWFEGGGGIAPPLWSAKYPLTSNTTSVKSLANTSIEPSGEAGTKAAFDTTVPSSEFNVDVRGREPRDGPDGQIPQAGSGHNRHIQV